ncbi:UNVERIFIED_CONTAM: 26S proteasome regulatory subunit 6B, partial [Sesamum indicum]
MVRDVFRLAKENVPANIFIHEVDTIATARFDAQTGADQEVQWILMELLNHVSKLMDLYKRSSEEWSQKAIELEGIIKALEVEELQTYPFVFMHGSYQGNVYELAMRRNTTVVLEMFGGGIPKKDGKIDCAEDTFARQGKHFLLYEHNCRLKHMRERSVMCIPSGQHIEYCLHMNGFDQTVNMKVIMETNQADTLDPALLRLGRLDRNIEFPLADRCQKRLVFQVCTAKMNLSDELDLEDYVSRPYKIRAAK